MASNLLAGVGRVNITPPLGVDIMGTSRRWQHAQGIHEDLLATCLVLRAEAICVVLVSCDLLVIPDPTAQEWRTRIAQIVGTEPGCVLLGCTHTHNGPATSPHMPKIGGDQTGLNAAEHAYIAHLGHQLESAAFVATSALKPARLAAGVGKADLNINRREMLPDGRTVIGRNIDGPCDEDVSVLRVDTEDGAPLAAVVTYTSHPVISPHSHLISPDFVGSTRRVVEQLTGAPLLFFTGAAGNINNRNYLETDLRIVERVGRQLGCEAARVFLGLKPQPTEVRPDFIQSVSSLKIYPEVPVDEPAIRCMTVANADLQLDLEPLPTVEEAEQIAAEKQRIVTKLTEEGAEKTAINPAIYQWLWAQSTLNRMRTGAAPTSIHAEIQVMRINDIALVAVPGEAFVEIALQVKAQSPAVTTIFVGYANGAIGYIPMREDYPRGGYEVREAHKGYGLPSALARGSAEQIVDTCLRLLRELWEQ